MRSEALAAVFALLVVAFAAAMGLSAGVVARARPTPTSTPTAAPTPTPSPTPESPASIERRAFAQPLAAGCATDAAVWLFADGGAAIRFDLRDRVWSIPDPSLRSLEAATCRGAVALAVGGGGSILTADDDQHAIRADRKGIEGLHSIALLPDGALAAGESGTVLRQTAYDWTPIGGGIVEDLFGVAASGSAIWLVGAHGAAYRPVSSGWERVPTGTDATLRAVAIPAQGTAIAAGDGGTLLRWDGGAWSALESGTTSDLRAAAAVGEGVWVVGDRGTLLAVVGTDVRRVDLATSCTLRAVFLQGAGRPPTSVWVVGSDGLRGGAWRLPVEGGGMERWGSC